MPINQRAEGGKNRKGVIGVTFFTFMCSTLAIFKALSLPSLAASASTPERPPSLASNAASPNGEETTTTTTVTQAG